MSLYNSQKIEKKGTREKDWDSFINDFPEK